MRHALTNFLCLAAVSAAAASAASAAFAAEPPPSLAQAFGNTIVSTYPDGRKAELWLNNDGTYTAQGRRHDASSGTWRMKGAKVCLSEKHPLAPPFSFCTPVPTGGIGTTWTAKAVTGETVQVMIVAGRA